jgi:hypothetical protein
VIWEERGARLLGVSWVYQEYCKLLRLERRKLSHLTEDLCSEEASQRTDLEVGVIAELS